MCGSHAPIVQRVWNDSAFCFGSNPALRQRLTRKSCSFGASSRGKEHQLVVGQRGQSDPVLGSEVVLRSEQRDDGLCADELVRQLADDVGAQRHGDVDRPGAKRVGHAPVPHLLGEQIHVRPGLLERLTERRQCLEARAPAVADVQRALLACGRAPSGDDRRVCLRQRPPCSREKGGARLRQPHLAARAHEQARADLLFELTDRDTERRLGHVEPSRGATEVELLRDGDEVAKLAQLRHHPSVLRQQYAIGTARHAMRVSRRRAPAVR